MKKIMFVLLMIFLLAGCSGKKLETTFMIQHQETGLYALYNQDGERFTGYSYKTFKEVQDTGYIVTNEEDQVGFISIEGEEVIPFGEYETIKSSDRMLYASKPADPKQKVIKGKIGYVYQNLDILNGKGEILYSADESTGINVKGLPIILKDDEYTILYQDGQVFQTTKDELLYAQQYGYDQYIIEGYEEHSILHDLKTDENEMHDIYIEELGQYILKAEEPQEGNAIVLYAEKEKSLVYVDLLKQEYEQNSIQAEDIYYDESNNLIIKNGTTYHIYIEGKEPIAINSYYLTNQDYLVRSSQVYGPHTVYKEGKKVGQLKNCQIFPETKHISSDIFPIYLKGKGYVYYNFDNKKVIKTVYYDAQPFNSEQRAIVQITDKGYSLIDNEGKVITKDTYSRIESLGHSYYAIFIQDGTYGIIDATGEEIFPIEYTVLSDEPIVEYNGNYYLSLQKNGRTYFYDIDHKMEEVFSAEGRFVLNEKGYFTSGTEYYLFDGEKLI